jgi:ParB family chromosome partitioning protein
MSDKKIDSRIKKGLGRGLSSLLGDSSKKIETNKVSIKDLIRNKLQPRKHFNKENLEDLTNSIKEQGVIQPIVVRPHKSEEGKYEIVAGERRWLASQNAGLNEVPVIVINADDVKSLELAIIENVQRQNLNPIEEARGYKKLINDFSYDQEKLAKFIGKSRSYIANSLRLMTLPDDIILLIESGSLSAGHGRALIGLNNCSDLAKQIVTKKLSVRQAESLSQKWKSKKIKLISKKDANILNLQQSLEEKTGLNVSINNKKNNSGTITFDYQDLDQLDKLINSVRNNY